MTKLYRILNRHGKVVCTRNANGLYEKRDSAQRAISQLAVNRWTDNGPYTIEETEVTWRVSD